MLFVMHRVNIVMTISRENWNKGDQRAAVQTKIVECTVTFAEYNVQRVLNPIGAPYMVILWCLSPLVIVNEYENGAISRMCFVFYLCPQIYV